jgi:RNA polymerase sigma-70 factor (ECF subfamily)
VQDDADAELVRRCRAGDMTAFDELVARHQDVVMRVASRIVGPDDSEDVAQDAFLRAFHRLGRFRGEGSFRGWLLQIARNSALDSLSANRRRAAMSNLLHAEAGEGEERGTRVPARELEVTERRERLRSKLRLLSDVHRTVLVLRDLEGLSYDEIAETTDAPLGSVKGRLHRARAELADLLRRNTYDWGIPRES